MPSRPRSSRQKSGDVFRRLFVCLLITREALWFQCNPSRVECFSPSAILPESSKQRTSPCRYQQMPIEMSPPLPYFAERIPDSNKDTHHNLHENIVDDEEAYLIFEEQLLNTNIEQAIVQDREDESSSSQLSEEQARALDLVREGQNVFLTGVAGTGKSLVLKEALRHLRETLEPHQYVAVAPTGSTAIVLEGQTMHSFAGIGIPKVYTDFRKMKSNQRIKKRWQDLKVLVLDEVSMISGEFFDSLSNIVSEIRKDPRPFGGIQLIVCGDFLQLSPIAPRKWEVDQMVNGVREQEGLETREEARNWLFLNRGFCFQSKAWRKASFEVVELKHVFRQSNRNFVSVLSDIRVGNVTSDTEKYLRENCERPLPPNDFGVQPTMLHSKNINVAKENLADLQKLSGQMVAFEALDEVEREKGAGPWVEKSLRENSFFKACTAEKTLRLKLGAQVMLIKNLGQNSMLTNGSRGTVVGFRKVKRSSSNLLLPGVTKYPVVQFKNGLQQVITPQKFQSRILGMGTCTRTTIPLKLAWAITTHKAQGLTLDYVIADVGQVFAEAQLYVALSRASDETGLELRNFSKSRVKANPLALKFHRDPNRQYPFWWDADGSKPRIMMSGFKTEAKNSKKSPTSVGAEERSHGGRDASETFSDESLTVQTVVELKQMLRERGLKVSGKKAELIERLLANGSVVLELKPKTNRKSSASTTAFVDAKKPIYGRNKSENFDEQGLKKRTVVELKQMLRERGLKLSGRKSELIERLITNS